MSDKVQKPTDKIKILENAKAQISREWLDEERNKTRLVAAINSLPIGFMIVDDYKKVIMKNPAVGEVLGSNNGVEWTVDEIQKKMGKNYNFVEEVGRVFRERTKIGPKDVFMGTKIIRIYMSSISIIKESITAHGVVILFEDITR